MTRAGAQAEGGTLIVESPSGFDLASQARLIGMIEAWETGPDRTRAPRIVATMGPDPQADVAGGLLRSDLYYRLAGVTITVPPLRARVDDIVPLARHLLTRAAAHGLPDRVLSDDAATLIRSHAFPGNVRELENMMRRLALMAAGEVITEAEMRDALSQSSGQSAPVAPGMSGGGGAGSRMAPPLSSTATTPLPAAGARLSDWSRRICNAISICTDRTCRPPVFTTASCAKLKSRCWRWRWRQPAETSCDARICWA